MDKKYALGFIGMGNMASAILQGILSHNILPCSEIIVCDIDFGKLQTLYNSGIMTTSTPQDVLMNADYVIMAVKPQSFRQMGFYTKGLPTRCLVSIMAGVTVDELEKRTKISRICRIMPNLPITVGQGMSCLHFRNVAESDRSFVTGIFSSIGAAIEVREEDFDAVTSISGSGPAYVFYFIKAMIDSGVKNGLSFEQAKQLTVNTFYGATRMLERSTQDISKLIDSVCSKGGTTIQAIDTFNAHAVADAIIEGVDKCFERSRELSHVDS